MKQQSNTRNLRGRFSLLLLLGMFVAIFGILIYTAITENVTTSEIPVPEYTRLFNVEALTNMKLVVTTKSKSREVTSTYTYKGKFNVYVFKIRLKNDNSLNRIINYKNESSYISMNAVYTELPSFNFDMEERSVGPGPVSKLYFKYSGDQIQSIAKNDSLQCYYFKFFTFSINYDDSPYDIVAQTQRGYIPASVIFKKKDKFIYGIIMTKAEAGEAMAPDLLYKMINK
ncbi:MAG: hypothetical protein JWP94_466 [Mucilaginibacter sp.]|nr:hypothetical protein [Mucilaginibacter sp.]